MKPLVKSLGRIFIGIGIVFMILTFVGGPLPIFAYMLTFGLGIAFNLVHKIL